MSQYKHKEFMTTATYPKVEHPQSPITRPFPSYYRIVLRSEDRDAGSTKSNACFSGVTVPECFSTPAVLVVNSFNLENADSSALVNNAFEIRLGGVMHPRSYDTSTKSATDLLCVYNGYVYQNQSQSADAVGLPITNPNQFQNCILNVYFKVPSSSLYPVANFVGNWTLVLDIIAYDGSHP